MCGCSASTLVLYMHWRCAFYSMELRRMLFGLVYAMLLRMLINTIPNQKLKVSQNFYLAGVAQKF